ncbi:MAG TPA: hypothetical protein VHX64_17620 [Caulobacteraceae bacterium]|jgi:hypothetical protein|nr:hypothetical protein [Caulobacteraceae bacterium]
MKLYSPDKSELMDVASIERDGSDLVIKGKVFSAMPMTARLRPEEARKVLKLVDLKTALFILTLPFRK